MQPAPAPPPAAVRVRRGDPDDAAELASAMERTFRDTYAATSDAGALERHVAEHFGVARQRAELADAGMDTLLLEVDGALAGFAQLRRGGVAPGCVAPGRTVELARLYVERAWHGRGVAARLMAACVDAAGEAGADALWLLVYRRNPRAIAFYGRHGFAAAGTSPYHFGGEVHDDVVMVRALDAAAGRGPAPANVRRPAG